MKPRYQIQYFQGAYYVLDARKSRIRECVHNSAMAASLADKLNTEEERPMWLRFARLLRLAA